MKVLITISDTGIGISQQKLKHIFDPFYQVDGSYKRSYQGAGLGLAIVKRLSQLLNASIMIDSEENNGTNVYFCIDLKLSNDITIINKDDYSTIIFKNQIKILLAEDDELNQLAISTLLEKYGYYVLSVNNGIDALNALEQNEFDCILMDIQMPEMTGLEAIKNIRHDEKFKHIKNIPIIVLTAYAMSGDKNKFLKAGADDYISKPIKISALKEIINKFIKK